VSEAPSSPPGRPPRWERAWEDVEDNDFGIDEFLAFCRRIDTEPLVVVNTGLGSVDAAAELVEYANGSPKTRGGSRRARAGHAEPYGVVWWGIGNEMYGGWQLGNVPVERYALRHNAFVRAMKAVDAKIKIVAVGSPGKWNDIVVPRCAASMDLLSAHHYTQRGLRVPFSPEDARKYKESFLDYSGRVAAGVRRLVDDLRASRDGSDPAVDHVRQKPYHRGGYDAGRVARHPRHQSRPVGRRRGSVASSEVAGETIRRDRAERTSAISRLAQSPLPEKCRHGARS